MAPGCRICWVPTLCIYKEVREATGYDQAQPLLSPCSQPREETMKTGEEKVNREKHWGKFPLATFEPRPTSFQRAHVVHVQEDGWDVVEFSSGFQFCLEKNPILVLPSPTHSATPCRAFSKIPISVLSQPLSMPFLPSRMLLSLLKHWAFVPGEDHARGWWWCCSHHRVGGDGRGRLGIPGRSSITGNMKASPPAYPGLRQCFSSLAFCCGL